LGYRGKTSLIFPVNCVLAAKSSPFIDFVSGALTKNLPYFSEKAPTV